MIKRAMIAMLFVSVFFTACWSGWTLAGYIKDLRNPEYFVSFYGWIDNSAHYNWGTYRVAGGIKKGKDLKELSEYIKDHDSLSGVTILYYRRVP